MRWPWVKRSRLDGAEAALQAARVREEELRRRLRSVEQIRLAAYEWRDAHKRWADRNRESVATIPADFPDVAALCLAVDLDRRRRKRLAAAVDAAAAGELQHAERGDDRDTERATLTDVAHTCKRCGGELVPFVAHYCPRSLGEERLT